MTEGVVKLCSFDSLILFAARHLNFHRAATTSTVPSVTVKTPVQQEPQHAEEERLAWQLPVLSVGAGDHVHWYDDGVTAMSVSFRNLRSIRHYHLQIVRDRLFQRDGSQLITCFLCAEE